MPYIPPVAAVASKGQSGARAALGISTFPLASPPVYNYIVELKTLKVNGLTVPEINLSQLNSPNNTEEFAPGMNKPGTIQFTGNYIGDATQVQISTLINSANGANNLGYIVTGGVQQNTKTYTNSGIGYFSKYEVGPFENGKAVEITGEIQVSGTMNEAVA